MLVRNALKAIIVVFAVTALFTATTPRSYAWPWSTVTEVKASATYNAFTFAGTFRCGSAVLYINGRAYSGSVSKDWFRNTCHATWRNIPVNKSATLVMSGSINMFGVRSLSGSKSVWIGKPALSTWQLGNAITLR